MAACRSIAFSTALHDLRAGRRTGVLVSTEGRFSRALIMARAVAKARMLGRFTAALSWAAAMAISLKQVWATARTEALRLAHAA